MALIHNVLILAVLCVLSGALMQAAEAGPHDHDHNHEHNHNNNHNHDRDHDSEPTWVSCDFSVNPKMRCHDCHTRLICKRIGGLLLDCPSNFAPYCNNGLCSPVPSMECA